ncbi:SecDF P1 head subdomain-containing protein [Achromobacter aegrifaciens]
MTRRIILSALISSSALLAACQPLPAQKGANAAPGAAQPAPAARNAVAQPQTAAPAVEFRLAQDRPGADLRELRMSDKTYYFLLVPALTGADLNAATPMKTKEGQPFVSLRFTPPGAQKLAQIGRLYTGKWLVFTIDGKLVGVPRIAGPMDEGILNLTMNSEAQAINVAQAITGAGQ